MYRLYDTDWESIQTAYRLSVDASVCFCAETDNTHESDRTTVMKNFFIALDFLVVYCNKTFNPSATCIA